MEFLSTLSLRRATQTGNASGIHTHWISIHALLAESDSPGLVGKYITGAKFLSTLSLRRATAYLPMASSWYTFLSTLSLRRATIPGIIRRPESTISIHALLAESDRMYSQPVTRPVRFLSTLSLRRATLAVVRENMAAEISIHALLAESDGLHVRGQYSVMNFYPRSPCGERRTKF